MFWKNHCNNCVYITSFQLSHRYGEKWDMYIHNYDNTVEFVARFGDEPENYIAEDHINNYDNSHPFGYLQNFTNFSDFTAVIRLLKTEEGGRRNSITTGYRPSLKFEIDDYLTTGYHTIKNKNSVEPGQDAIADIKIVSKDYFAGKLKEGMKFDLLEGNKKIGEGYIISIMNNTLFKK